MRKQALKNRNRQRTKAAKYRKQVERRAIVKATSNEERRKAQADRNVFTNDDDLFLADTRTSAMGLDSWLTEILTLVENSFEAGEVSRFAAMFFNSGGKRVTAIQGDNDIPSSWKKWCRTKEKRRCYAFVGTVFTGKSDGSRCMLVVAADRYQKVAAGADIDDTNRKLGELELTRNPAQVQQFCEFLPEEAGEIIGALDKQLTPDLTRTWKQEELAW